MVGPGTRPAEPTGALAPTYTGDSYVLLDLPQLALEALLPDNVVSLLARAHGMQDVGDLAPIVDEGLHLLRGPQREELDDVFFQWLAPLGVRLGVDLTYLEDKQMREQLRGDGEVRLMVEECLQAQLDRMKAESYEEGFKQGFKETFKETFKEGFRGSLGRDLDQERILLRRLTARKFGADTARHMGALLADIKDFKRLCSVVDWIVDCTTGSELLDRLQRAD